MTTRDERTRNLLQAGAFLKELKADASLPEAVRNEARRLLRHYPTVADIQLLASLEKRMFGSNLLTPEFDPTWVSAYQPGTAKSLKTRPAKAGKQMGKVTGTELPVRAPALDRPLRVDVSEPEHALQLPKEMRAAHPDPWAALRDDFDRLVERMQTPAHRAGVDALFAADGEEIAATLAAAHAREGARPQAETKQKIAAKKRLIDQMVKSTARASSAIDDAVAYVEASNRRLARGKTKKKKLR